MQDKFRGVSFCSWNVNGVNNQIKRGKVLSHLESLQADIMFLQETHLSNDANGRLRCKWVGQIYHSKFSTKARGTAILITTAADKNRRYVMVLGELQSVHLTLLNIYGPNCDDSEIFRKVLNLIPDISNTNLIIGADLNFVFDPHLDKSNIHRITPSNPCNLVKTYMENMNLVDIWRTLNPLGREYSFHSKVHNAYSRIDHFLVDGYMLLYACNPKYHNIIISDHRPVTFLLKLDTFTRRQRNWRFNLQLLENKKFCEYLESHITLFFYTNDKDDVSPGYYGRPLRRI